MTPNRVIGKRCSSSLERLAVALVQRVQEAPPGGSASALNTSSMAS